MTNDLLGPVAEYYGAAIERHGPNARGVDWNSTESQQLRFAQLLKVCHSLTDISLNDYGCGYGALLRYLDDVGGKVTYSGLDIAAGMLDEARKLHPGARFVNSADALPVADYTVASGIFNVRLQAPDDVWREHILLTIQDMAAHSRLGVAFNMLTMYSDVDRSRPDLYYCDPSSTFDYCKRCLSKAVTLLHDYPLFEFTILVRL